MTKNTHILIHVKSISMKNMPIFSRLRVGVTFISYDTCKHHKRFKVQYIPYILESFWVFFLLCLYYLSICWYSYLAYDLLKLYNIFHKYEIKKLSVLRYRYFFVQRKIIFTLNPTCLKAQDRIWCSFQKHNCNADEVVL